jgi:hypothetical protein
MAHGLEYTKILVHVLTVFCATLFTQLQLDGEVEYDDIDPIGYNRTGDNDDRRMMLAFDIRNDNFETVVMIVLPLLSGVLMTLTQSWKANEKMTYLEYAQLESLAQIYRYRTRTGEYTPENVGDKSDWQISIEKHEKWQRANQRLGVHDQEPTTVIEMAESAVKAKGRRQLSIRFKALGLQIQQSQIVLNKKDDTGVAVDRVLLKLVGGPGQKHFSTSMPAWSAPNQVAPEFLTNVVRDDGFHPLTADQYIKFRIEPRWIKRFILAMLCVGPKGNSTTPSPLHDMCS